MSPTLRGDMPFAAPGGTAGSWRPRRFGSSPGAREFPLQEPLLVAGVVAGVLVGTSFLSPLMGFAVFVLPAVIGALWRADDPPILAICIGYQWVFATTAFLSVFFTGTIPGSTPPGDVATATLYSLTGLLLLAVGVRIGLSFAPDDDDDASADGGSVPRRGAHYRVSRVFWVVMVFYGMSWFVEIVPRAVSFQGAQIISQLLAFRLVFLALLYIEALRGGRGFLYALAATFVVLLPELIGMHASFNIILTILLATLLGAWKPWSADEADRRSSRKILLFATALVAGQLTLGVFWQGAVKRSWRAELFGQSSGASAMVKMASFGRVAAQEVGTFQVGRAVASTTERFSGSIFFSHVVQRVPEFVPHENGRLTLRAVRHAARPRIFFPGKENLGSNSWMVRTYAGLPASDLFTSISIGYMAQLYVDFRASGMFLGVMVWGLLVGLAYAVLMRLAPTRTLGAAVVTVVFWQPFSSFEGEIAYMLGGLVETMVITGGLLVVAGPALHRLLVDRTESEAPHGSHDRAGRFDRRELPPTPVSAR